jgi:hypothetical protein
MIRFPVAAAACLMLVTAGCGLGRYDADYAEAVERHRQGKPFPPLRPPATRGVAGEDPPSDAAQPDAESGGAAP